MSSLSRFALVLLTVGTAWADVDLTPHFSTTYIAGFAVRRGFFMDGPKRIGVDLDGRTELSADEGGAIFRSENIPQASLKLHYSPRKPEQAFSGEELPRYTETAQRLLPPAAEDVVLAESAGDVFPINNWKCYRFTFTYRVGQSAMKESVTFLNLSPTQQIVILTGGLQKDFEAIDAWAWNIIRRWHEVTPEEESGAN